jgi:hypothetical protein
VAVISLGPLRILQRAYFVPQPHRVGSRCALAPLAGSPWTTSTTHARIP